MSGQVIERLVPGSGSITLFKEHEARYQFASSLVAGRRVLDIACGAGMGTSYLLRMGASECYGIDISSEAVSFARLNYPGPTYLVGEALQIPLRDGSVDAVVSFETIEHLSDPERFLLECRRVLVPGGIFIGSTPHAPIFRWIYPAENPFHLRDFDTREFGSVLSEFFEEVQLYAQSLLFFPATVFKQTGVRLLNVLGLTNMFLRAMGKSDLLNVSTAREYEAPFHGVPIRPYVPSWLWQPTFAIGVARKKC